MHILYDNVTENYLAVDTTGYIYPEAKTMIGAISNALSVIYQLKNARARRNAEQGARFTNHY